MSDIALEFKGVCKKFRRGERFNSLRDSIPNLVRRLFSKNREDGVLRQKEFWALKDVSFEVKKGEVLGIIGPNGAGKSTILKLLARIMKPNKGELKIQGRLSALIEITAGFHPELTGRENIYLNGCIMGMTKKEIGRKFDAIVEFSGLKEFIDTPVKRYSSGMYSRLGFSVAAHMDPDILLVDEVLAVGDMAFQTKCAQKMRQMFSSGTTIILVSHNLLMIQNLCKRAILLCRGEISREGETEEVISFYRNYVLKNSEEEFRKHILSLEGKVKLKTENLVEIIDVSICDGNGSKKEVFELGEDFSIKVSYVAKDEIENPIFSLDIIRSDGIVCCSSNTKMDGFSIESINNKGKFRVDLDELNLSSGVYLAGISIWDKDMIAPYAIRKKDVFKIGVARFEKSVNAVFLPKAKWAI